LVAWGTPDVKDRALIGDRMIPSASGGPGLSVVIELHYVSTTNNNYSSGMHFRKRTASSTKPPGAHQGQKVKDLLAERAQILKIIDDKEWLLESINAVIKW